MATNDWDDPNTPLTSDINEPSTLDEWNRLNAEALYRAKQRVQPISSLLSKAQEGTAVGTDVARTLLGGPVAAIGGAWQSPLQALSAGPGYLYRKYAEGDQQGADAYYDANVKSVEQNQADLYKRFAQPSTEQGRTFEEDLAAALQASKLPPVFPEAAGIGGRGINPNDVRVMGAEVKNFGKQVREVPADFQNAQAGVSRIDPLTGKPTLGVKLQGAAEGMGDIIAQREAAGKSAIPGLIDTKMNIVRPEGTRILRAKQPQGGADITHNTNRPAQVESLDPLLGGLNDFALIDRAAPASLVVDQYLQNYMNLTNRNNRLHEENYNKTAVKQARELFPDAPSDQTALQAMTTRYGGNHEPGMDQQRLRALDEYAKSPEAAAAVAQGADPIPSIEDFYKMHEASNKWRNNNLGNFISKFSGTASDPALKLAEQGLTFKNPDELLRSQTDYDWQANVNRGIAQTPLEGAIAPKLAAKQDELVQAVQEQNEIGNEGDPDAQRAAGDKVAKLRKEVDNLKLGVAYESAVDASIRPTNAQGLAEDLDYVNRQYFPSLTGEKDPNALAYRLKSNFVERLGFDEIAAQMHKDILSGKIALDKVPNISVDAYIKKNAEAREIAKEAEENQKLLYVNTVKKRFSDMAQNLPSDAKTFGNGFVLESTSDTPGNEVIQRASDDTGCMDHCGGQGGSASQRGYTVHPFTGREKTTYEPIMRLDLPGVPNPKASERAQTELTSYIRGVISGNKQLSHVRDATTGMPAATIEFNKLSPGKFDIGYVSGPAEAGGGTNGPIDEKYHNVVRDYLNSRADQINDVSSALKKNASVLDTNDQQYMHAAQFAGYNNSYELRAAYPDLPRFITIKDAYAIRDGTYQMPEPSPSASRAIAPAQTPEYEQLRNTVNSNVGNTLQHLLRTSGEEFSNRVENVIRPLMEAHDYATGIDPLIARIEDAANSGNHSALVSGKLLDIAYDLHDQHYNHLNEWVPEPDVPPAVDPTELRSDVQSYLDHMHEEILQNAGDNPHHAVEVADIVNDLTTEAMNLTDFVTGVGDFAHRLRIAANRITNVDASNALIEIAQGLEEGQHNAGGLNPPAVAPGMAERDPLPAPPAEVQLPRGVPEHDQELTFTDPHSIASHLVLIDRDADGTLNQQSIDSTNFALEHGQLDYPGYTQIPPGEERARAMAPIRTAYQRAVANAQAAEREQAMQAARGNLQTADYDQLAAQLTEGQRGYNQQVATQIARQARSHGVPVEEVTDMIRRGNGTYGGYSVDLSAFSPGQIEVLARDAHRMMTFNPGRAEDGPVRRYAKGGSVEKKISAPSDSVRDILYNNPPPAPMGENPYADNKTVQRYQSLDQPNDYYRGLTMNQYFSLAPADREAMDAQAAIDHPNMTAATNFLKMMVPGSMAFKAISDLYSKYFPGPPAVPEAAYTGDYSTLTPEQKTQYENVIAGQPSVYDKGLMGVNTAPQTTATVWTGRDGNPIMSGGVPLMTGYGAYLGPQQQLGRTIESAFSEGESPGDTQSFAEASAARDAADASQRMATNNFSDAGSGAAQNSSPSADAGATNGGVSGGWGSRDAGGLKKGGVVRKKKPTPEQMRFELMMRK